jgi:Arc-like DNA binding domain
MAKKKTTAIVPTMLRMREEMRLRLEREAKKNVRSLNTEMVMRLEGSFSSERDSQILKMMLGFSSENDQMLQLLFHLFREMKDLGDTEMQEIANRFGGLLEETKKKAKSKGGPE